MRSFITPNVMMVAVLAMFYSASASVPSESQLADVSDAVTSIVSGDIPVETAGADVHFKAGNKILAYLDDLHDAPSCQLIYRHAFHEFLLGDASGPASMLLISAREKYGLEFADGIGMAKDIRNFFTFKVKRDNLQMFALKNRIADWHNQLKGVRKARANVESAKGFNLNSAVADFRTAT